MCGQLTLLRRWPLRLYLALLLPPMPYATDVSLDPLRPANRRRATLRCASSSTPPNDAPPVRSSLSSSLALANQQETGYPEERFFIHCDGALFGMMVRCSGRMLTSNGAGS